MSFFEGVKSTFSNLKSEVKTELKSGVGSIEGAFDNRYHSFAPPRAGNDAKWFVDGCGYMWAVSVAIEEAKESIWILDWWLTPELYLRRPPAANENYRIDRMLLAAAERGVKVNIILYKEVASLLTLSSEHSKHALEVHKNIAVFRHPDHAPSGQVLESEIISGLRNFSFKNLANLPSEGLKALYGANDDVILYWAHHEKLCLIDGKMAFMGGLDLCFGRWDTNSHSLADAHPGENNEILFSGQDYNNARIFDFQDVAKFDLNELDRTKYSRIGWSDVSLCVQGPVIEDLQAHFVQRWNFIYYEKYDVRKDARYKPLFLSPDEVPDLYYKSNGLNAKVLHQVEANAKDPVDMIHGHHHHHMPGGSGSIFDSIHSTMHRSLHHMDGNEGQHPGGISVQLVRSCTRWSHGVATEHSIANAYIEVIRNSQHFVYIENQFFITATEHTPHPVRNKIGAALVERIVRAYEAGETYKVIVCIPSVPGFAGDLHADESLGTRAIMEYQYFSICRGGNSIMEAVEKAGVPDAKQYIRFYNLRNYDRINAGEAGQFDTVSSCYMDNGPSLKDIPWTGTPESEIDAFVSEELYIHSKVLIADDRVVICGSANLNDRSQLGSHDSEIAVVIQDPTPVDSIMAGEPFRASKYAASLRRQLFRKHLGLLPPQDWTKPDSNFMPINKDPNLYDWGSPADFLVRDVMSHEFSNLWNGTASANTKVFAKAFHCVPADNVRNWAQYQEFFGNLFVFPNPKDTKPQDPSKYPYGHIVKKEFPGGVEEVKELLGTVRGTLVEMPLMFMDGVDFAREGLEFNAFTDEIYT